MLHRHVCSKWRPKDLTHELHKCQEKVFRNGLLDLTVITNQLKNIIIIIILFISTFLFRYDLLIEFWTVVPMTPVIWSRFESGIYTFSEFLQAIKMLIKVISKQLINYNIVYLLLFLFLQKEKIHSEDLGRINDPAIENIILNRDQELSSELNFNISEVDSYSWRA